VDAVPKPESHGFDAYGAHVGGVRERHRLHRRRDVGSGH
jgi:hypothetical protein